MSFSSWLFIQECINDRELRLIGNLHENRQVRQFDVTWVVGKWGVYSVVENVDSAGIVEIRSVIENKENSKKKLVK